MFSVLRGSIVFLFFSTINLLGQSWVVSVFPNPNSNNVSKEAVITVEFSQAIDTTTISDNTVYVYSNQTGRYLSNEIGYNADTKTLRFVPSKYFKTGEIVDVIITKGIKNSDGNNMPDAFIWRFRIISSHGNGIFNQTSVLTCTNTPNSIVAADFNLDGNLDIASANSECVPPPNEIQLFFNQGDGSFTSAQTVDLGSEKTLTDIITLDIDGDGDLDISTVDYCTWHLITVLNTGAGTGNFVSAQLMNVPQNPYANTALDIEGDGDLDIAVSGSIMPSLLTIFGNNGNGYYNLITTINNSEEVSYSITSGDWDNDADIDLAVANHGSSTILVFFNNGNGSFETETTLIGAGASKALISGDINGDGYIDLATSAGTIYLNDGLGNFAISSFLDLLGEDIDFGDLDGDGDLDVASVKSDSLVIFTNDGEGNFTHFSSVSLIHNSGSLSIGDWDNDNDLDIAVTNLDSNSVTIFMNDHTSNIVYNKSDNPASYVLYQNYPNPFNPVTQIKFSIPKTELVKLIVFDVLGNEVETLVNEEKLEGYYTVKFDGSDLSSGIYFYRLIVGSFTSTKKLILLK